MGQSRKSQKSLLKKVLVEAPGIELAVVYT
jgi:hypothetical protein